MKSLYNIQQKDKITYITLEGTISIEFLKEVVEHVWQNNNYTHPYSLWDFRSCIMGIGPHDLKELVVFSAGDKGERGSGKVAIVVGKDLHFKMAQIYEIYATSLPFEVKAFQEIETAQSWLSEEQ